jgi:hypothetical protein
VKIYYTLAVFVIGVVMVVHCNHAPRVPSLIVLVSLVLMAVPPGGEGADTFDDKLGTFDFLCYETYVDELLEVELSCTSDLLYRVYDPDALRVYFTSEEVGGDHVYQFMPKKKGRYTFLLTSVYPVEVSGHCNFPLDEVKKTNWSSSVSNGKVQSYDVKVSEPRRPIVVRIEFDDPSGYDRIYPDCYDPDGKEIQGSADGTFTDAFYIFQVDRKGTYRLDIEGSRISEGDSIRFEASIDHPVSGPGIETTLGGLSITTLVIIAALGVIGAVSLFVLRRRRSKADEEPKAINPLSEFDGALHHENRYKSADYSYLYGESSIGHQEPSISAPSQVAIVPSHPLSAQQPNSPAQQASTPVSTQWEETPMQPVQPQPQASPSGWDKAPQRQVHSIQPTPPPRQAGVAYPTRERCGQVLMANDQVCRRCGAPR